MARRLRVSTDYLLGISDIRAPAYALVSRIAEAPPECLPSEALERIEEFKELMRIKYGKKE